mgnify:CR=1 FL=1
MRKLLPVTVVAAFAFALAGCTVTGPTENFSGLPELEHGSTEHPEDGVDGIQAFWLQEGSQIAVSIPGSSGCPVIGSDIKVLKPRGEGNSVEIVTVPIPDDTICTMDLVPHTSVFWTPANITTTEPVSILVDGQEIELETK